MIISKDDNSLLVKFAHWAWGGKNQSETMSPEVCLAGFPLGMPGDCWTQLLAKIMGLVLISLSLGIKTPMIRNVLHNQSAAGLSRTALYGEVIVYANSAFYGFLRGFPWTAYGEYLALVAQSATLVGLTWWFAGDAAMAAVSRREQILVVAGAVVYVVVATWWLPESRYYWLTSSSLPILLYGRGSQIRQTYHQKHTGAQSIISTGMSLGGSTTRVLTTLQEVGVDVGLLMPFFLSMSLNTIVCAQYILYYNNTQQFLEKLKKEREAKTKKE